MGPHGVNITCSEPCDSGSREPSWDCSEAVSVGQQNFQNAHPAPAPGRTLGAGRQIRSSHHPPHTVKGGPGWTGGERGVEHCYSLHLHTPAVHLGTSQVDPTDGTGTAIKSAEHLFAYF